MYISQNVTKHILILLHIYNHCMLYRQGMRSALQTVTLPDQRIRLGASTSQITYAMAISAFGPILGAPIGTIADRCVYNY